MKRATIFAVFIIAGALLGASQTNPNRLYQTKDLQVANLKLGSRKIPAWVMDTSSKRQEGMMFLTAKEVPLNHGMIFAFRQEQPLSFWMRNTLIDLDIAYINAKGKVVSVHRMKRLDETSIPGAAPAKYALEMKAGDFQRLGIRKGSMIVVPKDVAAKN